MPKCRLTGSEFSYVVARVNKDVILAELLRHGSRQRGDGDCHQPDGVEGESTRR